MVSRLPVALDAMGGDHGSKNNSEAAIIARDEFGVNVILVGNPDVVDFPSGFEIIECSEVIKMGAEPASAVRTMKDSSVVRAVEAVRDGAACASVSAGNTGATMAASLLRHGRIKGVARPPIAIKFPEINEREMLLADVGANPDCTPEWLEQFAVLTCSYGRHYLGIEQPKVALLTIGEEAGKGNALVKQSCELFASTQFSKVGGEFVGNVEGNDLLGAPADVVICDGFTGNVVLKALESAYELFSSRLAEIIETGDHGTDMSKQITSVVDRLNPEVNGTGLLLGLKGTSLITHGSASPFAIANALRIARDLSDQEIVSNVAGDFAEWVK